MGITYPSIGRCIYCGSQRYSNERDALGAEHIVPEALNGDLVFEAASCQKCERVTGRVEAKVCRNHLIGPRWSLGLRSKTKASKRSRTVPVIALEKETEAGKRTEVDVADAASALLLLRLGYPPLLRALMGQSLEEDVLPWVHWFGYNPHALAEKHGIRAFATALLDLRCFCRMLAKIAHAFAVANLGPDGFTPILTEMIRDPNLDSRDLLPVVGCLPDLAPPENELHWLGISKASIGDDRLFYVVHIRLFASLGAPTYLVVVGVPKEEGDVPTPPRGLGDSSTYRHNFYRLRVPVQGS